MTDLIAAAKLLMPHGLKGAIKAKVSLENPNLLTGQPLATSREGLTLTVTRIQEGAQNRHILHIQESQNREVAETLAGVVLYLPHSALPPLSADDVYFIDLIGRIVNRPEGTPAGTVATVLDNPAHPILELDGGQLIPLHEEFLENLTASPLVLTDMGVQALELK